MYYRNLCLFLAAFFLVIITTYPSFADDLEEVNRLNEQLLQFYNQGNYTDAAKFGEYVLDIIEKASGPDHPDTAISINNLAMLYSAMGAYDKAEPLYKRALAILEKSLKPNHQDIATSLNNLANLYVSTDDYVEAELIYKRALAIREKFLKPDHHDIAKSLVNMANLYRAMGDYVKAESLYKRALAILEKSLKPDHQDIATTLNNLANLYESMGDYVKAESLYKRTLSIYEKSLKADHPYIATALNNLAMLYKEIGDYTKVEQLYKRAIAILEKSLNPDHPYIASALSNLALLYHDMGDYTNAELLNKRALAIREKSLKPDHQDIATSLNNLANLYDSMGDYTKVESLFKRALAIREKSLKPDHPYIAIALDNLAQMYTSMGDYMKAYLLYKRALSIREKSLKPDHPSIATSLNNLANLYRTMGDYENAESLNKRALAIREKSLKPDHQDIATSLSNLAALYEEIGDYAKAEPLYKRALAIREKFLEPDSPATANLLNNLARLYVSMGDYVKVGPLCERVLTMEFLKPDDLLIATSLSNLARVYVVVDNCVMAERLYIRSLQLIEKSLGSEHHRTATFLGNLAGLYGFVGLYQKSLDFLQRGLAIEDRYIQNVFMIASEKQKLAFVKKLAGGAEGALSLTQQKFGNDQKALKIGLNIVFSRKGVVFDAQARQLEGMANSLDPEARELWEKLSSKRSNLAKLIQSKPEKMSYEAYRSRLEKLQSEVEDLESQLASMGGLVADELEQRKARTEKVVGRLPKDAVLIEFIRIRDCDWLKGEWGKTSRYLAFILHPDQKIELIDLGDADKLDKEVKYALASLTRLTDSKLAIKRQLASAEKLYTLIWEPLLNSIGDVGSVVVSPDGELSLVPFGALRDENGKFLIEYKIISYVTSGRDLLRTGGGIKPETDLFLAANPTFEFTSKTEALKTSAILSGRFRSAGFTMRFDPLPGTALEAETIPDLLPGKEKQVVKGVEATESSVLHVRRPKTMHLATHGFFLKDQQGLGIVEKGFMSDRVPTLPKGYENPLVRSGLAFAGANHADECGTSLDGLLTALEISGMDLHGTELVTLSACETAVGEVKAGEGVFGLRRAFALSGARNLLMSLWPVVDDITAEQMTTFYRSYGKGENPAKALRNTQLETIAKLRKEYDGSAPPSLWAPFILQGSPASQ